ncbi:DUF1289 domain-containing protein [Pseudomonas sp. 7P_10.2_Bac1]|uniref:DUF1289 domain-containing protein n=1 Tax=Pseudomonas sp. 7P_10.2_Bac1 TaxID=2971614 RepID=UPI0021C79920|nr:DUF1289 domain-containing protein [Pseudomonas sp. 7P_10.2_Bac1]MCU1728608.1 DUF1289 domain-containing protein [Pseudomonas sp. 7P_10.2_Bac1]
MSKHTIKTPCIGLCSTVFGDLICRGCKRFNHEIIQWNGYSDNEKNSIWLRLETLLTHVMQSKIDIFDPALLCQQLENRKIRYFPNQSAYCWAYQLLLKGAENIMKINAYGIELRPDVMNIKLPELRKHIDREFFELSQAHYQYYLAQPFLNATGEVKAEPIRLVP